MNTKVFLLLIAGNRLAKPCYSASLLTKGFSNLFGGLSQAVALTRPPVSLESQPTQSVFVKSCPPNDVTMSA